MTHDTKRADAPEPIVVECDLDAPPEKVWRALTEPQLLAAWLEPDAIQPGDDSHPLRLDFDDKDHTVEIETLCEKPHRLLRYRWRSLGRDEDLPNLDSVVTFELSESDAGGTHLRIVHDEFSVMLSASAPQRTFARVAPRRVHATPYSRQRSRNSEPMMRLAA